MLQHTHTHAMSLDLSCNSGICISCSTRIRPNSRYNCKFDIDILIRFLYWQYMYTYNKMVAINTLCVNYDAEQMQQHFILYAMHICSFYIAYCDNNVYIIYTIFMTVGIELQFDVNETSGWNIMSQPKSRWLGTFFGAAWKILEVPFFPDK